MPFSIARGQLAFLVRRATHDSAMLLKHGPRDSAVFHSHEHALTPAHPQDLNRPLDQAETRTARPQIEKMMAAARDSACLLDLSAQRDSGSASCEMGSLEQIERHGKPLWKPDTSPREQFRRGGIERVRPLGRATSLTCRECDPSLDWRSAILGSYRWHSTGAGAPTFQQLELEPSAHMTAADCSPWRNAERTATLVAMLKSIAGLAPGKDRATDESEMHLSSRSGKPKTSASESWVRLHPATIRIRLDRSHPGPDLCGATAHCDAYRRSRFEPLNTKKISGIRFTA